MCEFDFESHEVNYVGLSQLAAMRQRSRLAEQQGQILETHRAQLRALEAQNRIEQDRTVIERQRLEIEQQRFSAEEAERELRRQEVEQFRGLRNLMAETGAGLTRFHDQFLGQS